MHLHLAPAGRRGDGDGSVVVGGFTGFVVGSADTGDDVFDDDIHASAPVVVSGMGADFGAVECGGVFDESDDGLVYGGSTTEEQCQRSERQNGRGDRGDWMICALRMFFSGGYTGRMTFAKHLRAAVRRGDITCSVRIWTRAHVKVGGRYLMEEGQIEIDSIRQIDYHDITPELARESGFPDVPELLEAAKHGKGQNVYVVRFHYIPPRKARR
jgi:hypothetical protein